MINISQKDNGISILSLNRNHVNSLNISIINELYKVLQEVVSADINLLIIKSDQKHFCAGADLSERLKFTDNDTILFLDALNDVFRLIENLSIPTIASVDGACLGGGLELALSCDFRLSSNKAVFGFPETSIGIIPGAGGTQRLVRLVGTAKSMKWIFSADKYNSSEASRDGVVDEVYNQEDLDIKTLKFANLIMRNSPSALKSAKSAIKAAFIDEGFITEREEYLKILKSSDRNEGLESFKEKRKPRWKSK